MEYGLIEDAPSHLLPLFTPTPRTLFLSKLLLRRLCEVMEISSLIERASSSTFSLNRGLPSLLPIWPLIYRIRCLLLFLFIPSTLLAADMFLRCPILPPPVVIVALAAPGLSYKGSDIFWTENRLNTSAPWRGTLYDLWKPTLALRSLRW